MFAVFIDLSGKMLILFNSIAINSINFAKSLWIHKTQNSPSPFHKKWNKLK